MVTGGNEDLGTGELEAAVFLRGRFGFHLSQIGPALGFGQAHGATPAAFGQWYQVSSLLVLAAVQKDGVHGAHRQARVHGEGPVGSTHHLLLEQAHGGRQSLPAILLRCRQALPPALRILLIGFTVAFGSDDFAVIQSAAFLVAALVERAQDFFAEFAAFVEYRIDDIRSGILTGFQTSVVSRVVENLVEQELHVA